MRQCVVEATPCRASASESGWRERSVRARPARGLPGSASDDPIIREAAFPSPPSVASRSARWDRGIRTKGQDESVSNHPRTLTALSPLPRGLDRGTRTATPAPPGGTCLACDRRRTCTPCVSPWRCACSVRAPVVTHGSVGLTAPVPRELADRPCFEPAARSRRGRTRSMPAGWPSA
jgi:hypothetical protein